MATSRHQKGFEQQTGDSLLFELKENIWQIGIAFQGTDKDGCFRIIPSHGCRQFQIEATGWKKLIAMAHVDKGRLLLLGKDCIIMQGFSDILDISAVWMFERIGTQQRSAKGYSGKGPPGRFHAADAAQCADTGQQIMKFFSGGDVNWLHDNLFAATVLKVG